MSRSPHPESSDQDPPPASVARKKLTGLNPLGLMDAVLFESSTDWQPPDPSELETLMEGYEAFAYIDRGGMGAVYSAIQKSLSRRVAIKILPAELSSSEEFVRLFEREGRMLGQLQHPHIIAVYGSGRTTAGHLYIIMEYVEGVNLSEHLRETKPSLTKILEITAQVCDALDYAHARDVIHLDIKPGNILIDGRGYVRVADFGLSRDLRKLSELTNSARRTRDFIGTIGYAAPEQRRSDFIVDHRADIFSLGVTLYEMLTGQLPTGVFDPPSKKIGCPAHVDKIVIRAMRGDPDHRYKSAAEMRSAIAKTMLRLGTPLVKRAIISRPLISMVTCVIVGMCFIYLLDGLNKLLSNKMTFTAQAQAQEPEAMNVARLPTIAPLSENWAVITQNLGWDNLASRLRHFPEWQLAEIESAAEQQEVLKLLRDYQYIRPLWLGATLDDNVPSKGFQWLSGAPMSFQAWMPADQPFPIIITEIQARNRATLQTREGETPDWIEVHNPTTVPIDLTGYHLRHYFAAGNFGEYLAQDWISRSSVPASISMIMQPGEYRVICCNPRITNASGYTRIEFSLEGKTGRLEWMGPQGRIWQKFDHNWNKFPEDGSIGVGSNGKEWGWCQRPTPGKPNSSLIAPFPAPVASSPDKARMITLPQFNAQWSSSPADVPHQALLRRVRK